MITYRKGDLLEAFEASEVDAIVHQTNCFCVMKSGIAKQIAEKYPEVQEADNATERGSLAKLGTAEAVLTLDGYVFNVYGQFGFNRHIINTNYPALKDGLLEVRDFGEASGAFEVLGMPRIGCGLGGGKWKIVEKIVEEVFKDYEVIVYDLPA